MSLTEKPVSKPKYEGSARRGLKFLITCGLLFHLLAMIVLANGGSFLGRTLQHVVVPYGNLISINTTWNFFSPDPTSTLYLKYMVEFYDLDGNETHDSIEAYISTGKEKIALESSERRFLYAIRFLLLDEKRLETVLGPWLCRKYPGSTAINIEQFWRQVPSLDEVTTGSSSVELKAESTIKKLRFECMSVRDEVSE